MILAARDRLAKLIGFDFANKSAGGRRSVALRVLALVAASAFLTAALLVFMVGTDQGVVDMHFYVAFSLGSFFSLLIGFGLMSLMFYSARQGFDEPAEAATENTEADRRDSFQ